MKFSQAFLSPLAGLSAFTIWGSLVLYWKALDSIPPFEILLHRMFWSLVAVFLLALFFGYLGEVREAVKNKKMLLRVFLAATIIAGNWLLYIWSVNNHRVVEASLGYFINPLLSVLVGRIFLKEKLTRLQMLAISIAAFGVVYSIVAYGRFPLISIVLATSFAIYGYLKKTIQFHVIPGFLLESSLLFPLACLSLLWFEVSGQSDFFAYSEGIQLLLMGTGLITTLPLLLFAFASQHLQLATMGLMQYIAPSINLILGVYVFHESISDANTIMLICTWLGLILYTWCNIRQYQKLKNDIGLNGEGCAEFSK